MNSFTDEECWRLFRFRKRHLSNLITLLNVPAVFEIKGDHNGFADGEYATLYLLHRLRYPGILADCIYLWGRDYTQLSKLFNTVLDFLYDEHTNKVIGNIAWYQDRFNLYNEAVRTKLSRCPHLPVPGQIPANLDDIFAFLDCTANEICRPGFLYI